MQQSTFVNNLFFFHFFSLFRCARVRLSCYGFFIAFKAFLHRFQLIVIFLLICLGLIFEFVLFSAASFVVVIVKVDLLINGSVSRI